MTTETIHGKSQLYRGIFWITDIDDIYGSGLYFLIPCDSNGNISDFEIPPHMSSESTDNYNHKKVRNSLPKKITGGKPFDYYPRGRVEVRNGSAVVYYSPYIPQNDLKNILTDKFSLTASNGIKKVRFIADGSEHYRCFYDY